MGGMAGGQAPQAMQGGKGGMPSTPVGEAPQMGSQQMGGKGGVSPMPGTNVGSGLPGYGGQDPGYAPDNYGGWNGRGGWGSGIAGLTGGPAGMFGIMPGGIHPGSMYQGRSQFDANNFVSGQQTSPAELMRIAQGGKITPAVPEEEY